MQVDDTIQRMFTRGFLVSVVIEFGPVVAFFIATRLSGIIVGTAVLIVATLGALAWSLARDNRIPIFSVISSAFVLIGGTATLISLNPYWVVVEYTIYNGLFGAILLGGYAYGQGLLKPLFGTMFHISDYGWKILSIRWSFFFIVVAIGNEYVWRIYGEDPWVHYRLFAALFLALFGLSQLYLARTHRLPDASPWGMRR